MKEIIYKKPIISHLGGGKYDVKYTGFRVFDEGKYVEIDSESTPNKSDGYILIPKEHIIDLIRELNLILLNIH